MGGGGGCVCAELTVYVCVAAGAQGSLLSEGRRVFARKQAQAGSG